MLKYLLLFFVVSLAISFPGSFKVSFSRTDFVDGSIPQLADHFLMMKMGSDIEISSQFDLIIRGGYGSSEPSVPVEVPDSILVSDEEGRIWTIEGGMDYLIIPQAPFFLRATAGSAYILRDYNMGQYYQRYTERSWEPLFAVGLGSELPVDFFPVISKLEFLISAEWIGSDVMAVTGEIGIGI